MFANSGSATEAGRTAAFSQASGRLIEAGPNIIRAQRRALGTCAGMLFPSKFEPAVSKNIDRLVRRPASDARAEQHC